jgi:hypothetical protein
MKRIEIKIPLLSQRYNLMNQTQTVSPAMMTDQHAYYLSAIPGQAIR